MSSRDFCFWLQGFFEINGGATAISAVQAECIQKHLSLVFVHEIDPSFPVAEQATLNEIHGKPAPKIGGVGPDGTVYRC